MSSQLRAGTGTLATSLRDGAERVQADVRFTLANAVWVAGPDRILFYLPLLSSVVNSFADCLINYFQGINHRDHRGAQRDAVKSLKLDIRHLFAYAR